MGTQGWGEVLYYYYLFYLLIFFFGGGGGVGGVGGSENLIIMENADFVDTFWGVITKQDYFLGSFLCIYRSFLSSMYRTGIFLGIAYLLLLLFFWGWGVNSRSLV